MKTEYFHPNYVYSCIGYATSGALFDTSHAQLDTSPFGSATIINSALEQSHDELGEPQLMQLSYRWHLGSVISDWDATSVTAMHYYRRLFVHQLSYKQPECNKFLHSSVVTRYTTPEIGQRWQMSCWQSEVRFIWRCLTNWKWLINLWQCRGY